MAFIGFGWMQIFTQLGELTLGARLEYGAPRETLQNSSQVRPSTVLRGFRRVHIDKLHKEKDLR
jgi:hypothetical protein